MKFALNLIALAAALIASPVMADDYSYPGAQPAPPPLAEIQVFFGYRGYNNYDSKLVSTQSRPLSLDYIARGYQAAACYKGDPIAALDLFNEMIAVYNSQFHRAITFAAGDFYYYEDGKGALQIDTRDEVGLPFVQFPRMIECDRWSTPQERGEF